ncbi:MAG: hypothetical protein EBS01_08480 [Verrucomicrobia bacterium]|nr:hypothetical protein [Verrucomicrobiota bacterium]
MKRTDHPQVELQIAPLIDVCFLLLPGTATQEAPIEIPDEQRIEILESGQVMLNQEPLDTPESTALPQLHALLRRLAQSAAANKTTALVTLDAHDRAKHQRLVDVLNACCNAGIASVTFADASEAQN